ncbi:di-trans,poly-cis-decaprenylcistransferase [Caulobacter sp. CCUG 60055]|uniref:polyprenyl diphosphate synthase n=1 Tax=Caulobacter sp. CCUG 60055 TaxID=2100090 RepID=UPI0003C0FF01|nr:polyprenyl diphosphate synthase [Caulobacter sp. CCUG 60055]MBQ1540592.1 di-trans,poly-cis-decaprenylcistransferase [Caulobacteraceae bacterium]MCI3178835.1 di-trans,poly-cis-decaprenylcistransferase [Caulobacter sp. CCUG 60055]
MSPTPGLKNMPAQGGPAEAGGLHVAVIMDGNGRWAKARGLPRTLGHRAGVNALKRTVEGAPECGVSRLTVFGFSTENWRRPVHEVSELMNLLKSYVESDLARLEREGVRVRILGRRAGLRPDVLEIIERAERRTEANSKFHLQVAFNYGGQADIADAARRIAEDARAGRLDPAELSEGVFESYLSTAGVAAPDLIIRTSGERRLSNFLLWESAYSELVFQDVLWPDYGPEHLKAALAEFKVRERRYGGADVNDVLATG